MTDVRYHLTRLGLEQYAEIFIEEGFETWETVLHITESDLDHLKVKLGHRRVLQKEIAQARGITVEQLSNLNAPPHSLQGDDVRAYDHSGIGGVEGHLENTPKGKRKYKRHAKNDENAPERAPSAYVIFSNQVREELKPSELSFAEIAKLVGERWQAQTPEKKAPYERQAMALKEKYNVEMAIYKTTDRYRQHQEYLAEFKAKQSSGSEGKRAKLETEESTGSSTTMASGTEIADSRHSSMIRARHRVDSMGSSSTYPIGSELSSPASVTGGPLRIGTSTHPSITSISPGSMSPSSPMLRRESSTSSRGPSLLQPRPLVEPSLDPSASSFSSQRPRDPPFSRSGSSSSTLESRRPRVHDSPARPSSSARGTPSLIHQNTSSSSTVSSGSAFSSISTAPSSIYPSRGSEDDGRPHLPPISATGFKPSNAANLADYSLRKSQPPEARNLSGAPSHHAPGSPLIPPPPIASDAPPRASLRGLTLQQTPSDPRYPYQIGQKREPLQPALSQGSPPPTLPSIRSPPDISRHDSRHNQSQERDPLTLLADVAYADRDKINRSPSRN